MTLKIVHLYYDLMNLYGENGNIKALKKYFEDQNVNTEIHFLTIKDKINFDDYDIFYMGMGSEENQLLVLNDLLERKHDIKNAIENNKYFFLTGNSFELFGKYIIDFEGNKKECLNIFDYYTKLTDIEIIKNASNFRIVGETSSLSTLINKKIIGFQNRSGTIYDINTPLFKVLTGVGNHPGDNNEGFVYKNFYATYNIGPLFIRNPYLTEYFINKILKEKDNNFIIKSYSNNTDIKAYETYLENFKNI